jgi:hypothetical protein
VSSIHLVLGPQAKASYKTTTKLAYKVIVITRVGKEVEEDPIG